MIQSPADSMVQFPSPGCGLVVDRSKTQYFQLAIAIRSDDDRGVPDFLIQQGPANRRSSRNFPGGHVRLFAGYDVVLDVFILSTVVNLDRRTQANLVLRDIVHVDHGKVGEPLAQLAYAGLDEL